MVVVEVRGVGYFMDPRLKKTWDNLKDGLLAKTDDDRVYIVDGRERSGKSVFTIQQAAYIDPTILDDGSNGEVLPRITFTFEETFKAIQETKSTREHTKCIIFDEAFRGLSSKGATSKINKQLAQLIQEMGQNNLVLFIVAPRFFMLEHYIAVLRSHALFHIAKSRKYNKRYVKVFNEHKKGLLYEIGMKKGWDYNVVRTFWKFMFFNKYPGGDEFEKKYRKKKAHSLRTMGKEIKEKVTADERRFGELCISLRKKSGSLEKAANWLKENLNMDLTRDDVGNAIKKIQKSDGKFELKAFEYE